MAIEKGIHLIPFRTQKLSPSSPMVLYTRVWESRSLPSFIFAPSVLMGLFFYFNVAWLNLMAFIEKISCVTSSEKDDIECLLKNIEDSSLF